MDYSYSDFLLHNHFFWGLLAGMFLGGAVSRATMLPRKAKNPEKARERKSSLSYLNLTLMVIVAIFGVFIAGPRGLLDMRLLYYFGGAMVFFFLCFRFKKIIGIPLLLIVATSSIAFSLYLQNWEPFNGETVVGEVRTLSAQEDLLNLEFIDKTDNSRFISLKGSYYIPMLELLYLDDYYVPLGSKTSYHLKGFISSNGDFYDFPVQEGLAHTISNFIDSKLYLVPGIHKTQCCLLPIAGQELSRNTISINSYPRQNF
jgi:hypothetical protein